MLPGVVYDYEDEDDPDGFWDDTPPQQRARMTALFVLIGVAGIAAGLAFGFIVDLVLHRY